MVTIFPTPPQFSQLASLPNRSFFLPVFRSQGRPLRRHVHLVLSTFLPSPNPRPTLPLCRRDASTSFTTGAISDVVPAATLKAVLLTF
jgi:hypothetical protein